MALAPVTPHPATTASLPHVFDSPPTHSSMTQKAACAFHATTPEVPLASERDARCGGMSGRHHASGGGQTGRTHHDACKHVHFTQMPPTKFSDHDNEPCLQRRVSDHPDASSISTNLPSTHSFSSVPSTPPLSPTSTMLETGADTCRDRTRPRPRDRCASARERSLLAKRHRADIVGSTLTTPAASGCESCRAQNSQSSPSLPIEEHLVPIDVHSLRCHQDDRAPQRVTSRRPYSASNKSADTVRSPRSAHVRAHTIDNGANIHRRPLNMSDFRLGKVLGAGGTATVIRAEFLAKPGRPDLRGWATSASAAAISKSCHDHGRTHGHRRQPSNPVLQTDRVNDMPRLPTKVRQAVVPPNSNVLPNVPPCPREVALKVVQKKSLTRRGRHYLTREIAVHRALHDHNNVVPLLDVFEDNNSIYLVQELMRGGDLYSALKRERCGVYEDVALDIAFQILKALSYMHERGFAHRDIKPENVMFGEKPNLKDGNMGVVKLIDFGLACARDPNSPVSERTSSEKCGTIRYAAPEIVMDNCYVPELADVWSVGVVLYSAIAHCNPFTGKSEKEVLERIEAGGPCFEASEWRDVSEDTKHLIRWMLHRKATERPSAQRALEEVRRILLEHCGRHRSGHAASNSGHGSQLGNENREKDVSGFPSTVTPEKKREGKVEEVRHGPNLFEGIRALFSGGA